MELFTYDVSIKELPLMDTNANSDILTKKQNFERVYTSNAIGDVIRIDFGNPWEDALYMNFHIMKKETSKNSYPNVRSCNIRAVPSILSQNPKRNDDRISLDIKAGYNDNLVS